MVEQALFTSLQSADNEGYQIAAHSAGVDAAARRELTAWGPSHDSLQEGPAETASMNVHGLADGRTCLSLTRFASDEYSGRGRSVTTWMLLADSESLAQFGHHPLRLLDAALAAGWTRIEAVDSLRLVGRAAAVNLEAVAQATSAWGARLLALVAERVQTGSSLALVVAQNRRLLLDALLSLLPRSMRSAVSLTTGLTPSIQRPLRLHLIWPGDEALRTFRRTFHGEVLDLTLASPAVQLNSAAEALASLLEQHRWCEVRRLVQGSS